MLAVIYTDCIDSCKSNCHRITTTKSKLSFAEEPEFTPSFLVGSSYSSSYFFGLSYYVSLRSEFRVAMSVPISASHGNIHSVLSTSALIWFMRYNYVGNVHVLNNTVQFCKRLLISNITDILFSFVTCSHQ
jgi:hypothetical protein